MIYKQFGNKYIVRIDKGEELIASVKQFAMETGVRLATITGIGAAGDITIKIFDPETGAYIPSDIKQYFEIVSLFGDITTKDDEVYLHFHGCFADVTHGVIGGHLDRAVISATCELSIDALDGTIGRKYDDDTKLNLLDF